MTKNWQQTTLDIKRWALELGFNNIGIAAVELEQAEHRLAEWLRKRFHGEMEYMERHGTKRTRPAELIPGTVRVISVSLNYLPEEMNASLQALESTDTGYISRYALGRDYHKTIRTRLQKLADKINLEFGEFGYRAFCDSAPVMEKALAERAGIGWYGKHTNILNRNEGSWFFLGELYVNLPLLQDQPTSTHCGSCTACIDICPTQAIVRPYELDARKCISYLTIELHGSIPVEYRKDMGNRIYGCDDCQLVCPWNRYARLAAEPDFIIRHPLHNRSLTTLFSWDEPTFLRKTEGSAIRRIGYIRWLRNIAIALGNAPTGEEVVTALRSRIDHPSELIQ
ncbi:MAG: tRNA epoxyqueuosine(34) reductase QueG, partial [bacterium]